MGSRRRRKRQKALKRRGAVPEEGRRRDVAQAAAPAEAARAATPSTQAAGPLSAHAPGPPSEQASWFVYFGVIACFFLSGLAALLYQTAWLRQFSLVFGTSELAVATVLAAYMGGLALGAAIAGRYAGRITRPVLVYGILEAGIALSALAVPLLLLAARALYAAMLGDQPAPPDAAAIGQPIFYLLVAFVVLAIPTGFMGATLPLLIRYAVRTDSEVGPRVALFYAINTAGAVVGTVVAAFVLLPALGLMRTVWVGVAVNALVFLIAAALARGHRDSAPVEESVAAEGPPSFVAACIVPLFRGSVSLRERLSTVFQAQPAWMLPLMLVSGATSFLYEVLWTRMLTHVMGGSIYAFATMLAAFLTGIAIGGGLAGKVAERRERAAVAFAFTQLAVGVLSIGVYAWMGPLIPEVRTTWTLALFAVAVMLPATIFIGATLPLSIRVLARDESEATSSTARIYAWNTVGAIIGSILAGFVLIPGLGFEGAIRFAVGVNFFLALWAASCVARPRPLPVGIACAGLVATLVFYSPSRPQAVVASSGFDLTYASPPEELYFAVGRSSTVMLLAQDTYYYLRTNGLPEASVAFKGSPPTLDTQKWLTALPMAARPDTQNMLVVGFGGGVALEGVPASVANVDVVELETQVIAANRLISGRRNNDPLADPRFNIVLNDARNALRLSGISYDAIVSQPSHPWTAGASHLFTREFAADVSSRLNEGGVFLQWMNAEFLDEDLLRALGATLIAEFEYVRLYNPSARVLMFLASDAPLDVELELARTGRPIIDDVIHFSSFGINGVEDLLAALVIDEQGMLSFARRGAISTDDNNLMATRSRARADGLRSEALTELFKPHDPLVTEGSWVHTQLGNQINYDYLARRLVSQGKTSRAMDMAAAIPDFSRQFEIYGTLFAATGEGERSRESLTNALRANPLNMQARYTSVRGYLDALSRGEAPDEIEEIAAALEGAPTAVIRGLAHQADADWASLATLDETLAGSIVTDAWYPEVASLRAAWRVNMAEDPELLATDDRQRLAAEALALIEQIMILAVDENIHRMRAMSALTLGDADRLVDSSQYLVRFNNDYLTALANENIRLPAAEHAQIRQNLTVIANDLAGDLDAADPQRLATVRDNIDRLIEYVDDYPLAEEE